MKKNIQLIQVPEPGSCHVLYCGDMVHFKLKLNFKANGEAYLRTNLGNGDVLHSEIIDEVEKDIPRPGMCWFDLAMVRENDTTFVITIPLTETGHFEAKCLFLSLETDEPYWPNGKNTIVNVEPAETVCGNIIYNGFIRQFGQNKKKQDQFDNISKAFIEKLDTKGYHVIPPSGTFRDFIKELDFIFNTLGSRIIHLLPVHPTPTVFGKMGRFGSPYAALSFTDIDPSLAEFDPAITPVEQFIELVDEVHKRSGLIIMDIAINHTGWAAEIHESNPEWLARKDDGSIDIPGAWGVLWADLTKLDYHQKKLWIYMAEMFLLWCRRGVDGFRCDAGYMIPVKAWEYIVAKVRLQYPDTLFFLEGLGGSIHMTNKILNTCNFNWAYSELFQNYDREKIETYLRGMYKISDTYGLLIHYAETHDNNRLAGESTEYASMRTALCALTSVNGAFGYANGVEWYATEKIDVHESRSLNWDSETNQVAFISRITKILKNHPAFYCGTRLRFINEKQSNAIVLERYNDHFGACLIVAVNLDCEKEQAVDFQLHEKDNEEMVFYDLITEEVIGFEKISGRYSIMLNPCEVLCLNFNTNELQLKINSELVPERVIDQQVNQKVNELDVFFNGINNIECNHRKKLFTEFRKTPSNVIAQLNKKTEEPHVISWRWPEDLKRQVMIPPGFILDVSLPEKFDARIESPDHIVKKEKCLRSSDGKYHAYFHVKNPANQEYILKLSVYHLSGKICHYESYLLYLKKYERICVKMAYKRDDLLGKKMSLMGTNGRGAMMLTDVVSGKIKSRYEAILAANLDPDIPENRWMLLSRIRCWIVFQGFSTELSLNCLESFSFDYSSTGFWKYRVTTGRGLHVNLHIVYEMETNTNNIKLTFLREPSGKNRNILNDEKKIKVIIRPDIESRSFHETVKAFTGPERIWKDCVHTSETGFAFKPDEKARLFMSVSHGEFIMEPEWKYMVYREKEAERGLDPESDLYSPGYFSCKMEGNDTITLNAGTNEKQNHHSQITFGDICDKENPMSRKNCCLTDALKKSVHAFIVKRGNYKSVIAGYPWFLDWGRDSLIFSRGLIEYGKFSQVKDILRLFGQFENHGTLPNMICGDDATNRDTSDAPLWFIVACRDLIHKTRDHDFLNENLRGRSVRDIIISILEHYMKGTENGIKMDHETGLIYSPSHYTWMDTNYPACTPRQGYCIEIQALWYAALIFVSEIDKKTQKSTWEELANKVSDSIEKYFWRENDEYFGDCIHLNGFDIARNGVLDDALRPNQLFLETLGAVKNVKIKRKMLNKCLELLVPGAIRSLSDRSVDYPLKVYYNSQIINDPVNPYWGIYSGDEDTRRKPAYHNGTAWTWVFPSFCEAWVNTYGPKSVETALSWLGSCEQIVNDDFLGFIPEITDGDFPHRIKGCGAQAWGSSEFLRVIIKLQDKTV